MGSPQFTMNPEITATRLEVSEQPEQTSSLHAHPPFLGAENSSTGHQMPVDMEMTPNGTQCTTTVDTVDGVAADLLESAIEDEPDEAWGTVERKV